MRSKSKLPYTSTTIWKYFFLNNTTSIKNYYTTQRSLTIHPLFSYINYYVHNGKNSYILKVNSLMFGKKVGEFFPTKKVCIFKSKKNKKSQKKK